MEHCATEQLHPNARGLEQRPLAEGQIAAASSVRRAAMAISRAAPAMANSVRDGGVLHYVAAGSSGLMAAADAQELGGTFSIPPRNIRTHMASGLPSGVEMPGDTEDDVAGLAGALKDVGARDTVIAISASGSTPCTLTAARIARKQGATVIGIAN